MSVTVEQRYNGAVSIYYGPLLLSLQVGAEWYGVNEEMLLYEVYNTTAWNYAIGIYSYTMHIQIP